MVLRHALAEYTQPVIPAKGARSRHIAPVSWAMRRADCTARGVFVRNTNPMMGCDLYI